MTRDNDWEDYAFNGTPIIEIVKNEVHILAISTGVNNGIDSLLLLSRDGDMTIENLRPAYLILGTIGIASLKKAFY